MDIKTGATIGKIVGFVGHCLVAFGAYNLIHDKHFIIAALTALGTVLASVGYGIRGYCERD